MQNPVRARVRTRFFSALAVGSALSLLFASQTAVAQDLTLADALSRVARGDPSIAVGAAQQQAAEASIRQADVRPRDVIGVDVEDFAGTGPYSPIDRSQTTAWYERTWERGGKREGAEEHTSVLQSLMRSSYAVFCLKKKNNDVEQIVI